MKRTDRLAVKAARADRGDPAAAERGSVSIEMVIIVPVMIFMLLGFNELYLYMQAVSQVEHTAFTLADSVGQMTEIFNDSSTSKVDNLGTLWNAAALIARPEALQSSGAVVITSVCDATTTPCGTATPLLQSLVAGTPKIFWQAAAPWNQPGMNSQIKAGSILPSSWPFRNGDSALVIEIFYSYQPFPLLSAFWPAAPALTTIYRRVYVRPRSGEALPLVIAQ